MFIRLAGHAAAVVTGLGVLVSPAAGQSPSRAPAQSATQPSSDATSDSALRPYLAGNGFLGRGMYELAANEYRQFLAEHPDHAKAASARYALGVALWRMNQIDQAVKELVCVVEIQGFEFGAEVRLLLGQCAMSRERFPDAAGWFERLRKDYPDHARAEAGMSLLVECRHRAGDLGGCGKAGAEFVRRWPSSRFRPRVDLFRGLGEMGGGQYERAAELFETLLSKDSDAAVRPQATLLAAQCRHRLGELARATSLYRTAIQLGDGAGNVADAAQARLGLATLLYQQGKGGEAVGLLDEIQARAGETPSAPGARLARGRVYFDAAEYDQAASQFRAAAADPALADQAEYWLAKCELRSGVGAACAARLERAIATYPKSSLQAEMYYDRGVALLRAGDKAGAVGALVEFRERFRTHALDADALETLATLAHSQGEYDRCGSLCSQFLTEYPRHAHAGTVALLAAESECLAGRLEPGADRYREFLKANPDAGDSARVRLRLATILMRLDRPDEAVPLLQSVSQGKDTGAEFRSALLYLGEIRCRAGEYGEAERALADYVSQGLDQPSADSALLSLGLALARQERPAEAVAEFDRLLGHFPNSALGTQARFERAQALLTLGRRADAKSGFESVVGDRSERTLAPYALSHLGALAMAAGNFVGAADFFKDAADVAGGADIKAEALFNRAQALLGAGRTDEATRALGDLVAAYPTGVHAAQARAQRALVMARSTHDQAAMKEIDAALAGPRPEPALADALVYERARCLRELSRADEAGRVLRALIESPGDATIRAYARLELAAIEEDAGRHGQAADVLAPLEGPASAEQAALPPEVVQQAGYRLGTGLFRADRFKDASEVLSRFLASSPGGDLTPSACLMLGECWFKQGRPKQAAACFKRLSEEYPDDPGTPTALLRLGECLAMLQDWDGSRAAFGAYLERHAGAVLAYQARFGAAWADENQGRFDRAIEGYRALTESQRGPTGARAQFQIGECLFAQKKYDLAVGELLKVDILYAYPEWSAGALYEAGRCFEAAGKPERAREQFELVTTKYPESKWAAEAARRLKPVGAGESERDGVKK